MAKPEKRRAEHGLRYVIENGRTGTHFEDLGIEEKIEWFTVSSLSHASAESGDKIRDQPKLGSSRICLASAATRGEILRSRSSKRSMVRVTAESKSGIEIDDSILNGTCCFVMARKSAILASRFAVGFRFDSGCILNTSM